MVNKAIFFDRDGVLNELALHDGELTAPWSISEFQFKPNVKEAVDIVKQLGYNVYVVTNQPDVNDGKLANRDLQLMTRMLKSWLGVDEVMCAYNRKSKLYKPSNGMIEYFVKSKKLDRRECWIIGDRWKDIVAGRSSHLSTIYVGEKYETPSLYDDIQPDYIVPNVLQACLLIKEIEDYV
jgi:D-glycero-D-manno-heptose 1,7-bisphosphate phosphatase